MVRQHYKVNGQTPGDGGGQEPGVLHSMGSQRVEHDSVTEQQHLEVKGKIDACVHSALPAILTQDFLPCPAS